MRRASEGQASEAPQGRAVLLLDLSAATVALPLETVERLASLPAANAELRAWPEWLQGPAARGRPDGEMARRAVLVRARGGLVALPLPETARPRSTTLPVRALPVLVAAWAESCGVEGLLRDGQRYAYLLDPARLHSGPARSGVET